MRPPCCSTCTPPTCGAGSPPTCPGTWPASPGVTGRRLRAELRHPVRQGRRIPGTRRRPLPRRDPPRRQHQRRVRAAPGPLHAALLCDAIALAAKAVRIDRARLRAAHPARLRPRTRRPPHLARQPFAATGTPLDAARSPTTSPSTPPRPPTCPACPTPASGTPSEIDGAALLGPPQAHGRHRVGARRAGAVGDPRLRLWAHMLGYGGHFLTKSRRYSVTFGQLRRARAEHRRLERHGAPTANATPGAAPSMTPWSWSSTTGPMPEPATHPAARRRARPRLRRPGTRPTSPNGDPLSTQP